MRCKKRTENNDVMHRNDGEKIALNKIRVARIYGSKSFTLDLAVLCNTGKSFAEKAIFEAAQQDGCDVDMLVSTYARVAGGDFDSGKKYMSTIHATDNGFRMIVKGETDSVLEMCRIDPFRRNDIEDENANMEKEGLSVICVCYKDIKSMAEVSYENLRFAGIIGILELPDSKAQDRKLYVSIRKLAEFLFRRNVRA